MTRLEYVRDMTHSYVWHSSFTCVTWSIHICDMAHSYEWHDSFICVTSLIGVCKTTHSYVYSMTHSHVWRDSFIRVTWLTIMCDTTHSYVNSMHFLYMTWPHTYEWVLSHIYLGHITHMNESRHTYKWVTSHIWVRPGANENTSCHARMWVMSHNDSFIRVTWHSYVWHYYSCVGHDMLTRVTWLIHACDRHIHIYDMTHSCEWHGVFMCDKAHAHLRHNSFVHVTKLTCVTWLIHTCHMTHKTHPCVWHHSCVWHHVRKSSKDYVIFVWERHVSIVWVTWLIHICYITHHMFFMRWDKQWGVR